MYVWTRLAKVVGVGLLAPRRGLLEPSVLEFRVWPVDLDTNLHLNNGRYLSLMDLGRWDLLLRAGLVGALLRRRWLPMVARAEIRYLRPLGPFRHYALETRLARWDAKWIFIAQRFLRGDQVHAEAQIQGLLRGPKGNVPPEAVLALAGVDAAGGVPATSR